MSKGFLFHSITSNFKIKNIFRLALLFRDFGLCKFKLTAPYGLYTFLPKANNMSCHPIQPAPGSVIAFGNTLLDMTVTLDSKDVLEKYEIELGSKGEFELDKMLRIAEDVKRRFLVSYSVGGSALNSCRFLRRLGTRVVFFSAVGKDDEADTIQALLTKLDIPARLQVVPHFPTGRCVCFAYGKENALYANIGASQEFSKEYLVANEEYIKRLLDGDGERVIYIEGFFITGRFEICKYVVQSYVCDSVKFAFNLSDSYVIKENFEGVNFLVQAATFIFGNYKEFSTLVQLSGYEQLEQLVEGVFSRGNKILVCTNAEQNIEVYTNLTGRFECLKFPVRKVDDSKIKDTTGAGDSFVAGFLNAFLNHKSITECVQAGDKIARAVITQIGSKVPGDQEF